MTQVASYGNGEIFAGGSHCLTPSMFAVRRLVVYPPDTNTAPINFLCERFQNDVGIFTQGREIQALDNQIQHDRAMIRAHHLVEDVGVLNPLL